MDHVQCSQSIERHHQDELVKKNHHQRKLTKYLRRWALLTKATGLTDSSLPPQKRRSGKTDLVVDEKPLKNLRKL